MAVHGRGSVCPALRPEHARDEGVIQGADRGGVESLQSLGLQRHTLAFAPARQLGPPPCGPANQLPPPGSSLHPYNILGPTASGPHNRQNELPSTTSFPCVVEKLLSQVSIAIASFTNFTLPSPITTFTPPEWWLRAASITAGVAGFVSSVQGGIQAERINTLIRKRSIRRETCCLASREMR